MQEIAPGVFVETSYTPYNLGLITTAKGTLAIDIPPHPADAKAWRAEAEATAGPIRYVILTNAIPQRLVAAAHWNIPLIAQEHTARLLSNKNDKAWGELLQVVGEQRPEDTGVFSTTKRHRVTIAFQQHLLLHHRSPAIELHAVSSISPGSLYINIPGENLMFAGDIVASGEVPVLAKDVDIDNWGKYLAELSDRRDLHYIIPGRGRAAIRPGEIEEQKEFFNVTQQSARHIIKQGSTESGIGQAAQELVKIFFPNTERHSNRFIHMRELLKLCIAELEKNEV
ncbi:MAG: hypothetical protein JW981_07735 [Anaerolineae bacterium]|nr:hypothetical protein [Anaerolineae bacterium]